jgi:two-component system phosphate regulon sensor histidine kinase PhoR
MVGKNVKSILNGLSLAVFIVDQQNEIKFANSAAKKHFGQRLRGQAIDALVPDPGVLKVLSRIFSGARVASSEITLPSIVPTQFKVTATRLDPDNDGIDVRASVSFEDISHVHDAAQMRTDFVANVSHELRSPLTAVYGIIETLKGPARGDLSAQDKFLDLMEHEALRMNRLVSELLTLSRFQSSEREQPTDRVDVQSLLSDVVTTLSSMIKSEGTDVEIDTNLKDVDVVGNTDELRQVFQNLIENAVKYSASGSKVMVSTRLSKKRKGFLCVDVVDAGDGIDPEHIPRLTERFYRVDKGRSRSKGGTGLGLAIVKHILIRHRGRLNIESKIGEGSIFTVTLPLFS